MKKTLTLLAIALLLLCPLAANSKDGHSRQFQISLAIVQGDPLGSRADGTLRVAAYPHVFTVEGRPFSIASGGEEPPISGVEYLPIPFGIKFEGQIKTLNEGKLLLDFTVTESIVEKSHDGSTRVGFHGTRVLIKVKAREKQWIRWGKTIPPNENWVRIIVEEI